MFTLLHPTVFANANVNAKVGSQFYPELSSIFLDNCRQQIIAFICQALKGLIVNYEH